MRHGSQISEEELHAYLDGELSEERRREVRAYLDEHPEDARRLDAYRVDGEAIKRVFSQAGSAMPKRSRFIVNQWRSAAAAAAIFLAGIVTGWLTLGDGYSGDTELRRFAEQATTAHTLLSSPGPKSLDIASLRDVEATIGQVLGRPIELRQLAGTGLSLAGARLLQSAKARSVQLTFRNQEGETVTFYLSARPGAKKTPFKVLQRNGLATVFWEDDALACAVSGSLPPARLDAVAHRLYEALIS